MRGALWLGVLVLSSLATTAAAEVRTSVDRDPVGMDQTFRLTFELDDEFDGTPDFSALTKDFELLSTNQQTSINLLGNHMERKQVFTLGLMAKRPGQLVIPPIRFGAQQSAPLSITVQPGRTKSGPSEGVFVEVEVSAEETYPQAQVLYTIRLFRNVEVSAASLSEPALPGADAILARLGDDVTYETRRDGRRFRVLERRYALFPQRAGRFQFEPIVFQAQIVERRRSLLFDFGEPGETVRVRSRAPALTVQPIPARANSLPWLPATSVRLRESWSNAAEDAKVGEPLTRTVVLEAEGQTSVQLPELPLKAPGSFKTYPDQARLDDRKTEHGMTGLREQKVALVPTARGVHKLPAVRVPWWNLHEGHIAYAELPERTVVVRGSAPEVPPPAVDAAASAQAPAAATGRLPSATNPWVWVSLVLGAGWLASGWLWWRRGAPRHRPPSASSAAPSLKALEQRLRAACRADDAREAERALLALGASVWPERPPRGLSALARRSGTALAAALTDLEQSRYAPGDASWSGGQLWSCYRKHRFIPGPSDEPAQTPLPPLYPR